METKQPLSVWSPCFFVVGKGCLKKFLWKFYFVVSIFVYSFASINFIILNVIWKNKP